MPSPSYGPGKKRIAQLLRKASSWRATSLYIIMAVFFALAVGGRFWVLEAVHVNDGSMRPEIQPNQRLWICKLPICVDKAPVSAPLLAETRGGERVLRWQLGTPGDTILFAPHGKVHVRGRSWKWTREPTIIDVQRVYVPRKGDTLFLDSLDPMAFDLATRLFKRQWPQRQTWVVATLWNGQEPLPLSEVGRTTIGNRPVAQNEIPGLPWQELRLLEMQLQRIEASESSIRFKRRFYADSAQVHQFVVYEDCWFLACSRGGLCADSREEGFFPRSSLLGVTPPISRLSPVSPLER